MRLAQVLGRCLRLRCPRCGVGRLFVGWFKMAPECTGCHASFAREPGYFLGSIYYNYGVTAILTTAAYTVGLFVYGISERVLLTTLGIFCVVFPLWFFRYARALWMGLDELCDHSGTARPPREP
ncbi:MAG: DUF983 domain-containing protein [Planctomycetaceae bacterium]|nr:DUF983 domain-containing protein [Planctomycetaceae bacterium]